MQKKITVLSVISLLLFQWVFAVKKDSILCSTSIQKATIYYGTGCHLFHTSKVNITPGIQNIILNNIATEIDLNSVQIACPEQVTILSYTHRIIDEPISEKLKSTIDKWKDSIKLLNKESEKCTKNTQIAETAIQNINELIKNNFTSPGKVNISGDELIKLTNYYTDKISTLKEKINQLNDLIEQVNEKIRILNEKINEALQLANDEHGKKTGQLVLQIMSKNTSTINLDCSYFTQFAGWIPSYELRVNSADNTMKLAYKAMISQHTGLDWKNVKIVLNTGTPVSSNYIPDLLPSYLQIYVPILYQQLMKTAGSARSDMFNNVQAMSFDNSSNSDTFTLQTNNPSDIAEYLNEKGNHLNTSYEIDLPYDISSDDKAYNVHIKEEKLKAAYEHFAIPKLDGDAFFSAKIGNWGNLNILPGESNVIMDNMYIGKSYLNPNTPDDSMRISLGRDRSISISRKKTKEFSSVKKHDIKTEIHRFEIVIKNNKKQKVSMELKDQFPVSKLKEIEVVLKENSDAVINELTGELTWKVNLDAGEIKNIIFQYEVKYPKDKTIIETK